MKIMAKRPSQTDSGDDLPKKGSRHRYPPFQMRLHPLLRAQLEKLCERNASDMSEEIRIAVRKHLAENDLWPPTPE
jgi:hypothetical protein